MKSQMLAAIFQRSITAANVQQVPNPTRADCNGLTERRDALPSIDYCALHYLNEYLRREELWLTVMRGNDERLTLKVMQEFASVYRIARNFPVEHEKSGPRFQKILDLLTHLEPRQFECDVLLEQVLHYRDQISELYGGRNCLSATTKFLWLKLQSPIIIYDSQARLALGTKIDDLPAFYKDWRKAFSVYADDIAVACEKLEAVRQYSVKPARVTEEFIEKTATQRWFQERVFDMFLWNIGGQKVNSSVSEE